MVHLIHRALPSRLNSRAVLVIATLMPAAKHRIAILGESVGKTKQSARPKAAPAVKKGNMKPPRYPPATVREMAKSLQRPTMIQVAHEFISNPISPAVGHT